MCAVIIIFAFAMSLIINMIERIIATFHDDVPSEKDTKNAFAAEKTD